MTFNWQITYLIYLILQHIDKPEAKSQSKAQSPQKAPKSPQKGKEEFGLWACH